MVDIAFHCDEEKNFSTGYSVHAFTYVDYSIPMHNHAFYELNIVMSGTGIHSIENCSFRVKCGDVFVIPPMVAHAYTDTKDLEVYHILFQKKFFEKNRDEATKVSGFLHLTEIEPFLRGNFSNNFYLHLSQIQLLQLKNELSFLDDNGPFSWEEYSLMKYHTVWKILYWFSGLLNQNLHSTHSSIDRYELQIIDSLEYIHKNYGEKISIESLCQKTFLSRSTFLRSFKRVCSISPTEYLNRYRCKKAIEQLECHNYSKTEVAHNCGFYDLSHMDRILKKYEIT